MQRTFASRPFLAATLILALRTSLCGGGIVPASIALLVAVPAPVNASEIAMSPADPTTFACLTVSVDHSTEVAEEEPVCGSDGSCLQPIATATHADAPVAAPVQLASVFLATDSISLPAPARHFALAYHPPPLFASARHHAATLVKRE